MRAPSNLPPQPTRFFGREAELASLVGLLRQPDIRLVTLTGPGGSGKTRLALQAAATVSEDHPDGAFFVDLMNAFLLTVLLALPFIGG